MQTATAVYTATFKPPRTTTIVGEDYTPMNEPLSSGAVSCLHCGNGSFSQDAMAAQHRIQELEAQVRELTAKASQTAGKIADYENEVRNLREQTHSLNHGNDAQTMRSASTTSPTPETADSNTQQQQQQQQGRFAGFASYFPYRRTNSRAGSKDSSTPPNTSHSNYTNTSPGGGEHTSPMNTFPQRSLSQKQDSSGDNNATALQTALSREQSLRKAAETQLSQAHSELEELTAQLFSQANEMVASERKARAKLEERVALLEKRDGDKRKRLDRLEKAIARVERVRGLINS